MVEKINEGLFRLAILEKMKSRCAGRYQMTEGGFLLPVAGCLYSSLCEREVDPRL